MNTVKDEDVFVTLDNCWLALCQRMRENPTAETQRVMNTLARIITQAKSETRKRRNEENKQITIDEWLAWFKEEKA